MSADSERQFVEKVGPYGPSQEPVARSDFRVIFGFMTDSLEGIRVPRTPADNVQLELELEAGRKRIAAPADDRLSKYESRLQASALAMLRELRTTQAIRKGADNATGPASEGGDDAR